MNPIEARFEKWYRETVSPKVVRELGYDEAALRGMLRIAYSAGARSTIDRISEETFKPQTSKVNQ